MRNNEHYNKNNEYYRIAEKLLHSSYMNCLEDVVIEEPLISRYVRKDKEKELKERTNTKVHSLRVGALSYTASKFLRRLGLDVDVEACTKAGIMHDFGKYSLTAEEEKDFSKWGKHVERSLRIARDEFKEDEKVCKMIWKHQFPFLPPPYLLNPMPTTIEEWIVNLADKVDIVFFRLISILRAL